MTDARMLIIVPTRSRPENVAKVVQAWEDTDAFRHADLLFAIDRDDPKRGEYREALLNTPGQVLRSELMEWRPMVRKLDTVTRWMTQRGAWYAIGFAGDDHLPRTHGWAARYLETLIEMGTGVVSCPDGYRDDHLPTQWAMTADIVHTLGRMVPAPVEHLYCDNAVFDLAEAAGCYAYLDDVLIEHMNPYSIGANRKRKASWDAQYRHVNRKEQYAKDGAAYEIWRAFKDTEKDSLTGLEQDALAVRELREKRDGDNAPKPSGGEA